MANEDVSDRDFALFRKLFPEKPDSPYRVVRSTGTNSTLLTHGDFTRSLCEMSPGLRPCLAATAAIGVYSGAVTLGALINENSTYHNSVGSRLRERSLKTLRNAFAPTSDEKWIEAVKRNSEPFCDAIQEFIRNS